MRTIKNTSRFKRDYKRERKGRFGATLDAELGLVIDLIVRDLPLPLRYSDHPLTGEWSGYRDCHIRPDLILIYLLPDPATLTLVRLASHTELGF